MYGASVLIMVMLVGVLGFVIKLGHEPTGAMVFDSEEDSEKEGSGASGSGILGSSSQVVTSAVQMSRVIEENRQQSSAELLIRDETGRGQLTRTSSAPGVNIQMINSGDR